jgi:hypothetical protein
MRWRVETRQGIGHGARVFEAAAEEDNHGAREWVKARDEWVSRVVGKWDAIGGGDGSMAGGLGLAVCCGDQPGKLLGAGQGTGPEPVKGSVKGAVGARRASWPTRGWYSGSGGRGRRTSPHDTPRHGG